MRWTTLLFTVLWGCGPASLSGEVDGGRVGGARDAVFDTYSLDLGPFGELDYAVVVLTDFADACEVLEAYTDAFEGDCEERCEGYVDVTEEFGLGAESYWSFSMTLNVSDGEEGEFDLDTELGDGEFVASFSSWDARPLQDQDSCEESCKDNELFDADEEEGEDGRVEITRAETDLMSGRFDVELGGDEGLGGSFDARPCDTEDWAF